MAGKKFANANNSMGRTLTGSRQGRAFCNICAIAGECFALLIASCALLVALFHAMLGLWTLTFMTLFVAGALSVGAAMIEKWRRGRD